MPPFSCSSPHCSLGTACSISLPIPWDPVPGLCQGMLPWERGASSAQGFPEPSEPGWGLSAHLEQQPRAGQGWQPQPRAPGPGSAPFAWDVLQTVASHWEFSA